MLKKDREAAAYSVAYFTNHTVAYVVGGRVEMNETHLTRSNLKLVLLLLLLRSTNRNGRRNYAEDYNACTNNDHQNSDHTNTDRNENSDKDATKSNRDNNSTHQRYNTITITTVTTTAKNMNNKNTCQQCQ